MSASLSRIEDTLEENRIAPLRAAVTCLRIGDDTGALQRLIDAEAADPSASVPSFWLGLVLHIHGQCDLAEEKIAKAIRLNPGIVPPEWRPTELLPTTSASTDRVRWSIDVVRVVRDAVSEVIEKLWGFRINNRDERISGAGLIPSSIIFLIETPTKLYPCLASINLLSGKLEWAHRLPRQAGSRLLAVSRSFVAVSDPNSNRVSLHDAVSGNYLRSVGEAYLQAMMFPLSHRGNHENVVTFDAPDHHAKPLVEILQRGQLYGPGFFVEIANQYRIVRVDEGLSYEVSFIKPHSSTARRYDQ